MLNKNYITESELLNDKDKDSDIYFMFNNYLMTKGNKQSLTKVEKYKLKRILKVGYHYLVIFLAYSPIALQIRKTMSSSYV